MNVSKGVTVTTLTAPAAVVELFSGIREKAEIVDTAGNLLGYFTPLTAQEAEMYERAKSLFDPAEMDRIFAEQHGTGRPLSEIWKDLKARESSR
jgi:hypothetical protein